MTIVVIMAARKTKPPKTPKAIMPPKIVKRKNLVKNNENNEKVISTFTKIELLLS